MKATVCRPDELGDAEVALWRRFHREAPWLLHPFTAPEFTLAVGDVCSGARVAVVEDQGDVVGFFPYLASAVAGARPIGGRLATRQGFVHARGLDWTWQALARAAGLPAIQLVQISQEQDHDVAAVAKLDAPYADFSCGLERYWDDVGRHKSVKTTLYKRRKLERNEDRLDFRFGPAGRLELETLMALKSKQARRNGWRDPFARPWVASLVQRLARYGDECFAGLCASLWMGDELVAVDFSLRTDGVLAGWITAYEPAHSRHSPGAVLLSMTMEAAAKNGIDRVDFSVGAEPFKRQWTNAAAQLTTGMVRDSNLRAQLRMAPLATLHSAERYVASHDRLAAMARSSRQGCQRASRFVHSRLGGTGPWRAPGGGGRPFA